MCFNTQVLQRQRIMCFDTFATTRSLTNVVKQSVVLIQPHKQSVWPCVLILKKIAGAGVFHVFRFLSFATTKKQGRTETGNHLTDKKKKCKRKCWQNKLLIIQRLKQSVWPCVSILKKFAVAGVFHVFRYSSFATTKNHHVFRYFCNDEKPHQRCQTISCAYSTAQTISSTMCSDT